ncbi:MAG TPA: response regulator [Nitrospira sp.]|nr:response regulator [Nitrospira sp.]
MASTIFVIDSSPAVRRMVEQISTPAGYDVVGFQDGPAALEAARKLSPNLIITDYHLDNMTFSGFCKEVHKLDNLTDTYIVALTGATDKFDESHLKSLGVKAFLKKPFQSENLLDIIKDLDRAKASTNGGKKKRSWPPTSSATDYDDDESPDGLADEEQVGDEDINLTIPFPVQTKVTDKKETPMPSTPTAKQATAEPEEAMKGLFGQLLQSMSERTEKKLTDLLPQMVTKELAGLVAKAVETEVNQQLGAGLSQERLTQVIEPLLAKELPKVLISEMATLEPIIRHSIFEIASPLIKDNVDQMVREQADAVKASLPEAVREHLKSIEGQVQEEIKQAATAQAEKLAGDIVRAAADEKIQQAVQKLVPAIIEEQIKAEITRLTESS